MFGLSKTEKDVKIRNGLENYIAKRLQKDPDFYYNFEVTRAVNKMTTEQLTNFCDYIQSCEAAFGKEFDIRSLGCIGELFAAGFTRQNIDPSKYNPERAFYDIIRYQKSDFQYYQTYGQCPQVNFQQAKEDYKRMYENRINQIISKYGLKKDRAFFDHVDFGNGNIPSQGWKLHIAADSIQKYCEMVETLVPELVSNNVQFKIVNPENFKYENDGSNLYGKEFTIYPTKDFDLSKFSQRFIDLISETPQRASSTDQYFGCRITARFGGFTKLFVTAKDGCEYQDLRTPNIYKPEWIEAQSINDILNFHSKINQKLQKTGDYKLYLQEYMLGTECGMMDKYIFNEYLFTDESSARRLYEQTNRAGSIFNMFGYHIVVAPQYMEQQLDQFCINNRLQYNILNCPRYLDQINSIDYITQNQPNQSYQQPNQPTQDLGYYR